MKPCFALALALLLACGKPSASASIDSTGGIVSLAGGPGLNIPAGALPAATTITIEESGSAAPQGALSKLYKFSPEGTTFSKPVSVVFPVAAGTTGASIYWTRLNSTTDYEAVAVTVAGSSATGQITHFSEGALVAGRDLSGAFTEVHQPDTGSPTTLAATQSAGETISATVLMKSSSTGTMTFPGTLTNSGTFTIPGVPPGNYFLTITPPSPPVALIEASSSTPDLSEALATRVDLIQAGGGTRLSLSLTGLDPWNMPTPGDQLQTISSQAGVGFSGFGGANPPAPNATNYNGVVNWIGGLPSQTKGDTVYFLQTVSGTTSATPAGTTTTLKNCAAATNLTLSDSTTSNGPTIALTPAPQTGSLGADVLYSQFESLLTAINPNARRSSFRLAVSALPHSLTFPDQPTLIGQPDIFALDVPLASLTAAPGDTDYSAQPYGQCLDPLWKEYRFVQYTATVPIAGTTITDFAASITATDPLSPSPAAGIGPPLGPVKAPLVAGKDAFTPQSAVTTQPTLSWTAPSVGTANAYNVAIIDAATRGTLLSATLYTQTSFLVPPGVMAAGHTYFAVITARQASFNALDAAPFRTGTPSSSAQSVTAAFTP